MSTPAVSNQSSRAFPFRGIRVIDLLMAMAGAEVIKVELLTKEHLRRLGDMG